MRWVKMASTWQRSCFSAGRAARFNLLKRLTIAVNPFKRGCPHHQTTEIKVGGESTRSQSCFSKVRPETERETVLIVAIRATPAGPTMWLLRISRRSALDSLKTCSSKKIRIRVQIYDFQYEFEACLA